MARFNEILVGRYNRFFQKLLSMKGEASVVQLASEVQPALSVFNGAENRYLEGWDRFGANQSQAASAGNFSTVQFRNPAGSNVIAVVEKLVIQFPTLDFVAGFVGVFADQGVIAMVSNRFDARGRPQPTMVRSLGTPAAVFTQNAMFAARGTANTTIDIINTDIQEFPVLPGDSVVIQSQTANTQLTCGMWWRERFLEESERA